ncbi:hypothetical protein ACIOTI_09200 [Streptomyces sp. NPDC087843]|uniref:hypothetical protein n=1 Tax=Streptomyces sp. NPDC087843 TaxID=3365804 RepID=UPI00380EDC49
MDSEWATGDIRHVVVHHRDCSMRQPKDLEELLSAADDKRVLLHGEANRRDVSDPDDRFILRSEVAHACGSSDSSRRLKDALKDKAREGKSHVGNRPYGSTPTGWTSSRTCWTSSGTPEGCAHLRE